MNTEIKKISQEFVSKELLRKTLMEQHKMDMDSIREESEKKCLLKLVKSYGFNVGDKVETIEEQKYFDKEKGEWVKGKFSGEIKSISLRTYIQSEIQEREGYLSPMITKNNHIKKDKVYLSGLIRYQEQVPKNDDLENGVWLKYELELDDENIQWNKEWYSHQPHSTSTKRGFSDVFKKIKN